MSWPRIQTDVDDDHAALEDEIEFCESCGEAVLEGDLKRHAGEKRCRNCRHLCPECRDAEVLEPNEFCQTCAYAAMGVEV